MKLDHFDFGALADRYGTPFYLYDMDQALAHAARIQAGLPPMVDLFYCVKANANRRVLEAYKGKVAGLDLSSAGEAALAAAAGYDLTKASFAGPGKDEHELGKALTHKVGIISIESPLELERTAKLAAAAGKRQGVTLRVNPMVAPKEFPMKMGGLPSQFGIPEEQVDDVVVRAKALPSIDLLGFHVFAGTNVLEAQAVVENARGTLAIAKRLAHKHDVAPKIVNLGGGLGIPYFAGQPELDVDAVIKGLGQVVAEFHAAERRFEAARYILELGRFMMGEFGVYVTRVIDVKEARGKRFAIMDGGMHHCFPATGNFGQVIKKNYPITNLSRVSADPAAPHAGGPLTPHELVGPLCTPIDSMARDIKLPRTEVGDLVGFLKTGAYSFAASPLLFLSHDTPPELVHAGGTTTLTRERKPASAFA